MSSSVLEDIRRIPLGYSFVLYESKKYGITKSIFNGGNSYKIFAEELGGKDFYSLNYYITKRKDLLKPCEMSEQRVLHFLQHLTLLTINESLSRK
ncbi:peptide-methionine (S)-S-oxide reductase [Algoriphagus ratkowskyi]|uniref:Peptide methionine sulfoxide reductase n=1 Tax=Algoriphagus ratkowskyi TaxID=57028 RepID=A0A2W7SN41_9BACT|nr:peptide methionine sulfoxide reductase [Algoriphagus ratkowskyi]PZX52152.1 peptide-methionine (S)-S-oxide reductase [Algoriphagus ratkowskyi]TXD76087.1 peptide methionine sulfoxide reductase [Algoriphagus ratkowskyi]